MKEKSLILKIFFCLLALSQSLKAEIVSYEFTAKKSEYKFLVFERVNYGTAIQTQTLNKYIDKKEIYYNKRNTSPAVMFAEYYLQKGDKVVFNTEEIAEFNVGKINKITDIKGFKSFVKKKLVPCLVISKYSEKRFGYCKVDFENKYFKKQKYKELSTKELLEYENSKNSDLTLVYIIFPGNRKTEGRLMIKHKGKWVEDDKGNRFSVPVFGLSRKVVEGGPNSRMYPSFGTPQGVYTLFGVMDTNDPLTGKEPYLKIDDSNRAIGASFLPVDSFVLSEILPKESFNDYWVNEFALSQTVGGRWAYRIHGNSALEKNDITYTTEDKKYTFRPTRGCVNALDNIGIITDKLKDLGVIDYEYVHSYYGTEKTAKWNNSSEIGKVFVVIKDE